MKTPKVKVLMHFLVFDLFYFHFLNTSSAQQFYYNETIYFKAIFKHLLGVNEIDESHTEKKS